MSSQGTLAYSAYLFDLDGTLIDTAPDITAALNRQLASLDLPPVPLDLVVTWVGTGSAQLIRTALTHSRSIATHPEQQTEIANEKMVARLLAAYADDYARRAVELSTPYAEAFSTLRTLHSRGAQLAIVTNKLSAIARTVLRHFAIDDLFSVLIGGDDVAKGKPDAMPLLEACRRLNAIPALTVMVGDSRNDVLAARAAGIDIIAVNYGYNHGEPIANAKPDRIIASLAELL